MTLAVFAGLPTGGQAAEVSQSSTELWEELSMNENAAARTIEDDANGYVLGIAGCR